MESILSYLSQMVFPALFGLFLWLAFLPWRNRRRQRKGLQALRWREIALLLLFMFLAGLLALTLTPRGFWRAILEGRQPAPPVAFQGNVNLKPFTVSFALLRYYIRHDLWEAVWINFPGNILMFLPIGLSAGLLSSKPRWWKALLLSMALSFFIEFFQLFVSRATDIDDFLLNTFGGGVGYLLYVFLAKRFPRFVEKFKCVKNV